MTLHTILTPEWIHEAKLIAAENPRWRALFPARAAFIHEFSCWVKLLVTKRSRLVAHLWDHPAKNWIVGWHRWG